MEATMSYNPEMNPAWLAASETERFYIQQIVMELIESFEFWGNPDNWGGAREPRPHYTFIKNGYFYWIDVGLLQEHRICVVKTKIKLRGFFNSIWRRIFVSNQYTVGKYCADRNLEPPACNSFFYPVLDLSASEQKYQTLPIRHTHTEDIYRLLSRAKTRHANFLEDAQNQETLDFLKSTVPSPVSLDRV